MDTITQQKLAQASSTTQSPLTTTPGPVETTVEPAYQLPWQMDPEIAKVLIFAVATIIIVLIVVVGLVLMAKDRVFCRRNGPTSNTEFQMVTNPVTKVPQQESKV